MEVAVRSAPLKGSTPASPAPSVEQFSETLVSSAGNRPSDGRQAPLGAKLARWSTICLIGSLLAFGYWLGTIGRFTPEEGTGYWLGICGGSAMLVLLLYPLRKRVRFMRRMGAAPYWFRLHMILGIAGPLLILYHSNFSLGATNSNIALFSMLLVSSSGIAGRYIYAQIHNGLYGAKSTVHELLENTTALLAEIERDVGGAGGSIAAGLTEFGAYALRPSGSASGSLLSAITLPFSAKLVRSKTMALVRAAIRRNSAKERWTRRDRNAHFRAAKSHVSAFLDGVVKAAELSFYERLFSLWHVLHVPLFFLLIVTGVVHVVSVHMY
jgi:hypothetical protein